MPRHTGGPEEPVLAWRKSHEQDRRCRQPPHHPWERGTNENTNGLLREFFPKGKDITDTPEDYIQRKYHELNLRPSVEPLSYIHHLTFSGIIGI